jgi:hypothetical protein
LLNTVRTSALVNCIQLIICRLSNIIQLYGGYPTIMW